MSNYSMLSTDAWTCIIRGASSWKMDHSSESEYGLRYTVHYPNGYGAFIIKSEDTYGGFDDLWEVNVLKDGAIVHDAPIKGEECLTDVEVVYKCSKISSL